MKKRSAPFALLIAVLVAAAGCRTPQPATVESARLASEGMTADIEAAIRRHIADQAGRHGGYVVLPFGGTALHLKLVRVHTEYLATLGPRRHFACVDLADVGGDVYDVDYFLVGDPGAMAVVETMVHKINGQPLYAWEQAADGAWRPVPVKNARLSLLGVLTGRDEFEFRYKVTLPEITDEARMWMPLPVTDEFQAVKVESMRSPVTAKVLEDQANENRVLFMALSPENSGQTIEIIYRVHRLEKSAYAAAASERARYLAPERLVPDSEDFRSTAARLVEGKEGDLMRARALYDHVIDRMRYMKYGSGWGKGDAAYACSARTGNCTDFHAYFIALARSVGIPARFAIGAAIPSERNTGGIDGYHCWVEFCAEGKWWPVDISEADKYSSLSTYYFGHHPANRFEFSRGRDLVVDPGPASGPINFLAYPLLEIAGKPVQPRVEFSFTRI